MRTLGRTPGGRGNVNADLQLHKPPSPPAPCDGWPIRSGGPTGCHILVSLHMPSIVFFLPSLAGDYQTHLTDKLPDYTQSPKMNPVVHVSLELGRTPPQSSRSPSQAASAPRHPAWEQDLFLPTSQHLKESQWALDSPRNP